MAIRSRDTLKNWFRTGLKPLQSQFWDWIDSFLHKNDKIPSANIDWSDFADDTYELWLNYTFVNI